MLEINWSDVLSILQTIRIHLIVLGVIVAVAVVVMIACLKLPKQTKFLIRCEALVAILVAITVVTNLICTGPMYTILSLASGNGSISEESSQQALSLGQDIADEGIVLLENHDFLPLNNTSNLNVFGWASVSPVYGGTGSGALNTEYDTVTLLEGLEDAGFSTNTELSDFYTAYTADSYGTSRPTIGMRQQDWTLPEPPVDTYSDQMISNAKDFSDTAVIVIGRSGGEHTDLPRDLTTLTPLLWGAEDSVAYENNSSGYEDFPAGSHYLELSRTERDMVDLVCENFENVIVVYNGANAFELGFTQDYEQIKSVIWCPGTGQNGFASLGRIMNGTVNPSGKTADTFVYDLTTTPTWNNFGNYIYENMDEYAISEDDIWVPGNVPHFVNYVEGIYVGYRFYETADTEGLIDYAATVQYPFGYGLSYTSFTQEMGAISERDGMISFDVSVTNTGNTAGKDVVQVYYNPPYTNGGIEKASANLVAFDKTDLLQPGASQTLTISFKVEDMASYDTYGNSAYILEAGDYIISINEDSHTVIDSEVYNVSTDIIYDENNIRSTDKTSVTNQFSFAEGNVTYLSRADGFANYDSATAAPTDHNMLAELKASFVNNASFVPTEEPGVSMPQTGQRNGVRLEQLRGLEYDDELWDDLLDELTIDEMNSLVALGGYQTVAIDHIGKVLTTDCDGPASINNNFTQQGSIGFPAAVMIANTWNEDLAYEFGVAIGTMADEMNVSGWYAPAMNIHRSAFSGRNFEYYSEDGLLSGKIATQAVLGAETKGVYAYIKHFALNDQETNRWQMLCTWSNEQAIREIYLKPFELAVKDGGAKAVMSSYNYIGNQWAGGCGALLTNVLRNEWGFQGFVLTDYFANFGYMSGETSIYNGGDTCLATYDTGSNYVSSTDNPTTVQNMRRAAHNIFYTTVNSRAYAAENINPGLMSWQIIMIAADVVVALAVIAIEVAVIRKAAKKRAAK